MYASQERFPFFPKLRIVPKPSPIRSEFETVALAETFSLEPKPERQTIQENEIRQFDLMHSFAGLPKLVERFGYRQGLFQSVLGVVLNIWSLRQEMLGEMDTREVITLIEKNVQGELNFKNDLYGQAQNIQEMFLEIIPHLPPELQQRYELEAKQAIKVFEKLAAQLAEIDFSVDQPLTEQHLIALGFHQEEIDVSPSMIANLASLRESIHSAEDLQWMISQRQKITAWVGPRQALTVSLPHWSHHRGETGFVWAGECVVIPETGEMFIRQQGKFGKAKSADLVQYLGYARDEELSFSSEAEVMMFVNLLQESEYRQPRVLLDWLVSQLGGLKPVGKIDRNVQEGELDIQPYFEAVMQVFDFEIQQQGNLTDIAERLADLSDKMKHQIARNQPKALPNLVKAYQTFVQGEVHFTIGKFQQAMNLSAVRLDRGFKVPIDFSLIDCVAGTPLSLGAKMSMLQNAGQMTRADLANVLGQRAKEWKNGLECIVCHKVGWVGECNICLNCEMNMNGAEVENSYSPNFPNLQSSNSSVRGSRPFIQLFPPPEQTLTLTEAMQLGPKNSVGLSHLLAA